MLGNNHRFFEVAMNSLEITHMSVAEKLQTLEALWEALDDEDIVSPDWHHEVLKEREGLLDRGEATFVSLDELKKRL